MFVVGNFLGATASVLGFLLQALLVVLVINAVLSWIRPDPRNPFVALLDRISDFVCDPLRRLFPTVYGGIDFAPFIAMLAIWFLQMFVVESLRGMAIRMG